MRNPKFKKNLHNSSLLTYSDRMAILRSQNKKNILMIVSPDRDALMFHVMHLYMILIIICVDAQIYSPRL